MTLIRSFDELAPARGGILSIGNFDGVHRGHHAMIQQLVGCAKERNAPAVVLTFDPHPIKLLAPDKAPPSLSTLERKSELLHRAGADFVIAAPTTRDLLSLTAIEFFEQIVVIALGAIGMMEGPNFHFGAKRGGDVALLQRLCRQHDLSCQILNAVADDAAGEMISSSLIRAAISEGRIADAVRWLGHAYQICGIVVHGDARGRELGFPTANVENVETLLPPDGVYAARCHVNGQAHAAAVNIGGNPTFGVDDQKVEVHLIDFEGDLYGQRLAIDLLDRVRGVAKFDESDALRRQLKSDLVAVNAIVASNCSDAN